MTPVGENRLKQLMASYEAARAYSIDLVAPLSEEQILWRPHEDSSAIGWHLGHQGAVNHYMVRNLTAAEPSIDPEMDAVFDSATLEPDRGRLPEVEKIMAFRDAVAASTARVIAMIAEGRVGAPRQLAFIADGLLRAVINHEYQHAEWIAEVRGTFVGTPPPDPRDADLVRVEGYWMLRL